MVQRELEDRKALFSCYYWALYAWNKEEMAAAGAAAPPQSLWLGILVCGHACMHRITALLWKCVASRLSLPCS